MMNKNKKWYLVTASVAISSALIGGVVAVRLIFWSQPSKLDNVARQLIYKEMTAPTSLFTTEIKKNNGISSINIFRVHYRETPQGRVATVYAQVLQRNHINSKTMMSTATFLTTERLIETPAGWRKYKGY
jgi:hypothetical protein